MSPRGRATEQLQSQDTRKANNLKATSSLFLAQMISELERTLSNA